MLTLADVFHFLTHKLACLSTGRLSLAFVPASPFDRLLLWHVILRNAADTAA
jgi:hypothetical protein